MKFTGKIKPGFIIMGILLAAVLFFYIFVLSGNPDASVDESADCTDCSKKKAGLYLSGTAHNESDISDEDDSGIFSRIFSLLNSGAGTGDGNEIIETDPEKDRLVIEINSLSENVCNDEKLPGDVWISPKMIEADAEAHKRELEKLILYCSGLKNGKTTTAEKRDYYRIKIKLLEERKELIRYYIETLDGQIEDMNEKKIAEMEDRKPEDKMTPEEERINREIETETNRFYEEAAVNSDKLINQINEIIKNYQSELERL